MAFVVEHECPQCGAPVDLEETDRLLKCPYCEVASLLVADDCFRYVLPHDASSGEMIYAPYMRFKGTAYICSGRTIAHRIVDITRCAAPAEGLPPSLGFRPQVMKMKLITPEPGRLFLKRTMTVEDAVDAVSSFTSVVMASTFYHRAYIGDTINVIYLPLYRQGDALCDGITHDPLVSITKKEEVLSGMIDATPRWSTTFLAAICPSCGWDLRGERDSVVFTCPNCFLAWSAMNQRLKEVPFKIVPGRGNRAVHLPFWNICARSEEGLVIRSYGDFIKVTNQPKVVQPQWEEREMSFWIPAFKIRPNVFLHLSKQMTVSQEQFNMVDEAPSSSLYPVTLPLSEALQGVKLIFADSIINRRRLFPQLPQVSFIPGTSTLVYLPFADTGQEIIQEHKPVSIHKKTLEFGRYL
jgi:hypothetical protein